jgi:hypothetical protein
MPLAQIKSLEARIKITGGRDVVFQWELLVLFLTHSWRLHYISHLSSIQFQKMCRGWSEQLHVLLESVWTW